MRFRDATMSTGNRSACVDSSRVMAKRFGFRIGTGTFPCRHTADRWKEDARIGKSRVILILLNVVRSIA
jgi:hypothetical protein